MIVTRQAAYFTDSLSPVLYRVELGPGGRLLDQGAVETIPLSGNFESVPGEFNANGIEATPDGKWLIVVNSTLGTLYRVLRFLTQLRLSGLGHWVLSSRCPFGPLTPEPRGP